MLIALIYHQPPEIVIMVGNLRRILPIVIHIIANHAKAYWHAAIVNSEGKSLAASRDGGVCFNYADFILRHKMPLLLFDT